MVANQSSLGTVATAGGIVPIGAAPAAVAASDSKKNSSERVFTV